jgi:hypothetical protein
MGMRTGAVIPKEMPSIVHNQPDTCPEKLILGLKAIEVQIA